MTRWLDFFVVGRFLRKKSVCPETRRPRRSKTDVKDGSRDMCCPLGCFMARIHRRGWRPRFGVNFILLEKTNPLRSDHWHFYGNPRIWIIMISELWITIRTIFLKSIKNGFWKDEHHECDLDPALSAGSQQIPRGPSSHQKFHKFLPAVDAGFRHYRQDVVVHKYMGVSKK